LDSECGRYWLIFKWFLPMKIQINPKKPGFGRRNQLRKWSKLKGYHSIQAWFHFMFGYSKHRHIHCKTMFTCWVSLFCNEFTLGPTAHATLLSMKEGSLFCFVVMRSTEPGSFRSCSWCLLESSWWGGVHGLGSMACGLAVQKCLNIEWFIKS
jgi:hypothetical protein